MTEAELASHEGVTIVLAEPGAGKTRLLTEIANQLNTNALKANIFRVSSLTEPKSSALVLDALDEVARQDPSAIDTILVKASESLAKKVILASRSSEWELSRSEFAKECFAAEPRIIRLKPLDEIEQRAIFDGYVPEEEFSAFRHEVQRFDLEPLLGNPQFLKLFADAYVESGRSFTTKSGIFDGAVRRLAHEANQVISQKDRPPAKILIQLASELFAKLLLSGSVGISTVEGIHQNEFPFLNALVPNGGNSTKWVIDTRLMQPTALEGQHEPVHRIVAEYCAARHLASRIDDPHDFFSLRKCFAIVAPNSVVRSELRGLFGWLASLGKKAIQEEAIKLDPYAILANGDPSRLELNSKLLLLDRLNDVAEKDPFFRRTDVGRTFSTAGFFDDDIIETVSSMLSGKKETRSVTILLLEMLESSDAASRLIPELRTLLLDPDADEDVRVLAYQNLAKIDGHNRKADHVRLIDENSPVSLQISASMFRELGVNTLGRDSLLNLLLAYISLCDESSNYRSDYSLRHFTVRQIIADLEVSHTEWLLNRLTDGLLCRCGEKHIFKCHCRDTISKVVGRILDRYFAKAEGRFDPEKIWKWTKNLVFHGSVAPRDSVSVRTLQEDHELRRGIQLLALGNVSDSDEISKILRWSLNRVGHIGLRFRDGDDLAIIDYAFEHENASLWSRFIPSHDHFNEVKGPNSVRTTMRTQARQKPALMEAWSRRNHASTSMLKEHRQHVRQLNRSQRRRRARNERAREHNLRYLNENRVQILRGRDFEFLGMISWVYLNKPNKLCEYVDDSELPETALSNCVPFIEAQLPTLQELGELHCQGSRIVHTWETILCAGCLAVFRRFGSLASVDRKSLAVLKTMFDFAYQDLDEQAREQFQNELDKRLFKNGDDVVEFARQYLEKQLELSDCCHPKVDWLRYKSEFEPARNKLPFEWLDRFPAAPIGALDTLFDLAVQHCDRNILEDLIIKRCCEACCSRTDKAETQDHLDRQAFWNLRQFFFSDEPLNEVVSWLKSDPNTIFALVDQTGWFPRSGHVPWPDLSARKILLILDTYIEKWKKVHLPSSWGTRSPKKEDAYRFLTRVVWMIKKDHPHNRLHVLDSIVQDKRFEDFHDAARNMLAETQQDIALMDFKPPTPSQIVYMLDKDKPATVEGLRAVLIDELDELQRRIDGGEFDTVEKFYSGNVRVDELTATNRIADDISLSLKSKDIIVTKEHHLKDNTRCDITAAKTFNGVKKLVVIEVKGQWNPDLYSAPVEQLYKKYSIHPNAADQGIYVVVWFGAGEKIAGRRNRSIKSPGQLRAKIVDKLRRDLRDRIDVYVLDVSRTP